MCGFAENLEARGTLLIKGLYGSENLYHDTHDGPANAVGWNLLRGFAGPPSAARKQARKQKMPKVNLAALLVELISIVRLETKN